MKQSGWMSCILLAGSAAFVTAACSPAEFQIVERQTAPPVQSVSPQTQPVPLPEPVNPAPVPLPPGTLPTRPTPTPTPTPTPVPPQPAPEDPLAPPTERIPPKSPVVCDPTQTGGGSPTTGLSGNIYYLPSGQTLADGRPRYTAVNDYVRLGQKVNATLFMNRLHIPTRSFLAGFATEDGQLLTNDRGDLLIEYFAIRLRSHLMLKDGEEAGDYQLALLSDDGSILEIGNQDGRVETLIDNDGAHPTRLGCSARTVRMQPGQTIPIQLKYYQGPRYHIALTLLWRKVKDGTDPRDPLCGAQGENSFHDSRVSPPVAQKAWSDLMARGWRVVDYGNFGIEDGLVNPCK